MGPRSLCIARGAMNSGEERFKYYKQLGRHWWGALFILVRFLKAIVVSAAWLSAPFVSTTAKRLETRLILPTLRVLNASIHSLENKTESLFQANGSWGRAIFEEILKFVEVATLHLWNVPGALQRPKGMRRPLPLEFCEYKNSGLYFDIRDFPSDGYLWDCNTFMRAAFSPTLKFLAMMTGNLLLPSKNAYSRWGGKSLSSTSGGSVDRASLFDSFEENECPFKINIRLEIDMSCSNTNDSSMYAITNKRAKINLDSSLLWHCHLGHISKKRIEKLQHDGLLNSIDIKSFGKCVSCLSGKPARKPYSHQVERAKDLLGLIHTDVFQKEVENQLGKTIKSLRSDRGGEYMSQEFLDHLKEHGIISHRTPSYTPQNNGVSERRNRTLLDMVRSIMSQTTLPKSFWDYALETATRILNMVPTKKVAKKPYEVWHGQAPKLSYLKVWGCEALVKRDTLTKPDKLDPTAFRCIFVGYPKETIGYSFYNPSENKVFVARNAEFFENDLIDLKASGSVEDLELIQEEDTNPSVDTSLNHDEDDQEINEPQSDINPIRDLSEPANYKTALLDPKSNKWLDAMNMEMQSMKDNDVWVLVELPPNARTIYIRAIRILIALAAYYDYEIWQMDVKTAFLNGHLFEEVYMEQPEGFVNPKYPNHVCKLKRSIYGLKQASRQWNKRFDDEIKKFGFTQNPDEPCVYQKASGSYVAILILYVDDILLMGNNIPMLQDVKSYLGRSFSMKDLGDVAYILGIKIYRDRSKRLIGLCQGAYIEKILKRYYMENSKRGMIPMQEKLKLSKSQGEEHWTAVKNILKYLRNTKDMFLVYRGNMERELQVSYYTDAGYLTDADDLKSQTGYVFVLNGGAVNWKSTKQSIFATSSTDDEYIAGFDASKEAVWIRKFISGLGIVPTIEEPISMYCDNTRAIAIAKDDEVTKGARHFHAKVHYLRETIKLGDVKIEKVDTDDNLVETDIREKDEKSSQKQQNRAWNGKG
ncbi:retrotransposon protein, putative, ty1-copia subclass [Tanacetum coccineum]